MVSEKDIKSYYSNKKRQPTKRDLNKIRDDVHSFIPFITYVIERYNVKNADDLKNIISFSGRKLLDIYRKQGTFNSNLYQHQTLEHIIKNPSIIAKELPKIKDEENNYTVYNANQARSIRIALMNAKENVEQLERIARENNIKKDLDIRRVVSRVDKEHEPHKQNFKKMLILTKEILNAKSLQEKILVFIKSQKEAGDERLKESIVKSIYDFYDFFESFGFADTYIASYIYNSKKFGFGDLEFEKSTGNTNKDNLGLKEAFSKEFLQTQDISELCFIYAFWVNRLAKECKTLNRAACTIDYLDLYEELLKGKTKFDFTEDELIAVYRKYEFISDLVSEKYTACQDENNNKEVKHGTKADIATSHDFSNYFIKLDKKIGADYQKFFSENLKGKNNLTKDLSFAIPLVNLKMSAYSRKDTTIQPIINYALNKKNIRNWGIIREEVVDGKKVDSIKENKRKILLDFDVEDFNMPFRFHFKKDAIIDLLKMTTGSVLIPEYQGAEDFVKNGEAMPTNIIMPIPKRHKKIIMEAANLGKENKDFWEHIYFLVNGKFPKHLTDTIQKNKKQVVSVRKPIYYTDLKIGKRYLKQDGKTIPADFDEGR